MITAVGLRFAFAFLLIIHHSRGFWFFKKSFQRTTTGLDDDDLIIKKRYPYVGLMNCGNTCYLDAIIQSLFYARIFSDAVISTNFSDTNGLGWNMQQLFIRMSMGGEAAVEPNDIIRLLNIDPRVQEDAQELLLKMLNSLDSSLSQFFVGQQQNIIMCRNVPFVKKRAQKFLDLSLDVSGLKDLATSLSNYLRNEPLEGENKYRAGDFGLQDADKHVELLSAPPILCIHLKRFSFDSETGIKRKISDYFEFPIDFDLTKYMGYEARSSSNETETRSSGSMHYKLQSIVDHEGSVDYGHYTCLARPDLDGRPDHWLLLNDHVVTEVSPSDVTMMSYGSSSDGPLLSSSSSSAYILLYVRS